MSEEVDLRPVVPQRASDSLFCWMHSQVFGNSAPTCSINPVLAAWLVHRLLIDASQSVPQLFLELEDKL
jgi:hypothetical protein